MFKYIYKNKEHSDVSREYMTNIGMDATQIDSVINQKIFEESQIREHRRAAYKRESDSLRSHWQYEAAINNPDADVYKQKWMNKVEEIKSRYPLPLIK